jgi:HEAT repeat protein
VCLPKVLERIESKRHGMRMLVDVLGEIGGESELPVLVSLLADPRSDDNMRASAAAALGGIGGTRARDALVELLADRSEMLRLYALDALREADAVVPVAHLEPLLARSTTRKAAASLMGRSRALEAVRLLVPLLTDAMRGVRSAAAEALVHLHRDLPDRDKRALQTAVADADANTRTRVRELVDHSDGEVACAAIELSTMAADPEALRPAIQRMQDPIAYERTLDLVGRLGDAANPALAEILVGLEVGLREAMYRLIGAVRAAVVDPTLVAALMEGLDDIEPVAVAAAESLRRIGGRGALAPLYRACGREGPVGEHAAEALADVAARGGGGRHDDLLLLIGGAWPQQGTLATNLCRVVGRLGLVEFVPPLVSMLGSRDVPVRVAAAHALGNIPGEHEGLGALSFALADEESQAAARTSERTTLAQCNRGPGSAGARGRGAGPRSHR